MIALLFVEHTSATAIQQRTSINQHRHPPQTTKGMRLSSSNSNNKMRIPIPTGKIGFSISGSPPMVTQVQEDSPMAGSLEMGHFIHGLVIPHRLQVRSIQDSYLLGEVLEKTSQQQERILIVTNDEDALDTNRTTEFHVTIPPGKLGLTFEGDRQPTICKVWDYCPVRDFVEDGQWLKAIQIPGERPQSCRNLSAREVYEFLQAYARIPGRVLVLTNPPVAVAEPVSQPIDESSYYTASGTPASHARSPSASTDYMTAYSSNTAGSCNTAVSSAASISCSSTAVNATMDERNQVVTIELQRKQRIRCNHEHMLYMADGFRVKTHGMNVRQFQKGYPLGMSEFIYEGRKSKGRAMFGSAGTVQQIKLEEYGGKVICRAEAYLCSEMDVRVYVESVNGPGSNLLIRVCGNGNVWLSGNGSITTKTLAMGETVRCATASVMAFEKTIQFSTHYIRGGLTSVMTPGKGDCCWAELAGPGTFWLQGGSTSCASTNAAPSDDRTPRQQNCKSSTGMRNGTVTHDRVEL